MVIATSFCNFSSVQKLPIDKTVISFRKSHDLKENRWMRRTRQGWQRKQCVSAAVLELWANKFVFFLLLAVSVNRIMELNWSRLTTKCVKRFTKAAIPEIMQLTVTKTKWIHKLEHKLPKSSQTMIHLLKSSTKHNRFSEEPESRFSVRPQLKWPFQPSATSIHTLPPHWHV